MIASGCCSCCSPSKNAVVVNRDFLKKLHDAPTLDRWDANIYALQYLVENDDPFAVETGWRVLPVIIEANVVYKEIDWLALALYDARDLKGVEALPAPDQAIVIRRYDELRPLDWGTTRETYLNEHPKVAKLLLAPAANNVTVPITFPAR